MDKSFEDNDEIENSLNGKSTSKLSTIQRIVLIIEYLYWKGIAFMLHEGGGIAQTQWNPFEESLNIRQPVNHIS